MAATKFFFPSTNSCDCAAVVQMEMVWFTLGGISPKAFNKSSLFLTTTSRDILEPMTAPSSLTPTKISPDRLFLRATAHSFILSSDASGGQYKIPGVLRKVSFSKRGSCMDPSAGKIPHSIGHGSDNWRKYEQCTLTSFLNAACWSESMIILNGRILKPFFVDSSSFSRGSTLPLTNNSSPSFTLRIVEMMRLVKILDSGQALMSTLSSKNVPPFAGSFLSNTVPAPPRLRGVDEHSPLTEITSPLAGRFLESSSVLR